MDPDPGSRKTLGSGSGTLVSSLCVLSAQVQYHLAKKRDGRLSARVETLLRDLERDVARRERFLRECARMVGAAPHLEQEVGWRMEHVLTKWDMLAGLRLTASRNNNNSNNNNSGGGGGSASDQLPEMYADIELEVRSILNISVADPCYLGVYPDPDPGIRASN